MNIKSTGFKIAGDPSTVFLTDTPNIQLGGVNVTNRTAAGEAYSRRPSGQIGAKTGILSVVKQTSTGQRIVVSKDAGIVDYEKGEIILNTINIVETSLPDNIVEIQAFPESNDIVGLKDLYLSFDVSNSTINMIKDVIASGEDISGVSFTRDYYTSSYSNGALERK